MKVLVCICKGPKFDEEDAIMDADDMIGAAEVMSGRWKAPTAPGKVFHLLQRAQPVPGTRHGRHRSPAKSRIGRASEARSEEVEEEP